MVQLKVYKATGAMQTAEAEANSNFKFGADDKDASGEYFYAIGDSFDSALYFLTLGLEAVKAEYTTNIAALDNLLAITKLRSTLNIAQVSYEAQQSTPQQLNE